MYLSTDEQTIEDLRIFGKRDSQGLFDLYNHSHTRGAENVLKAYDGTLAVTEAFAGYQNCLFIVSTHIIEVGEALKEIIRNEGILELINS